MPDLISLPCTWYGGIQYLKPIGFPLPDQVEDKLLGNDRIDIINCRSNNIDGQAAIWKIDGQEEITPPYDEKGERIPDGGRGIRYILNKKIRLTTGSYKLFLGIPEDEYAREFVISVKDGVSTLEFKPVYRGDHQRMAPSFLNGIQSFELFYEGSPIRWSLSRFPVRSS